MILTQIIHHAMAIPPGTGTGSEFSPDRGSMSGVKARILIVEDEFLVAMTIEETLLEAGHDIVGVVATGEEALQAGVSLRPDLVLMDIRLAGQMSGIDAALKLRAKGIPSLFATSHSDPGTRISSEKASPIGWLAKPFSEAEVVTAVEDALARLRQH
ncbi:response regulator [Erythrobacter sp. QSSC1-22B]|uniref:response regulator n=1 Tax=Erythrobacter sp. QSSC1-22B TaxID=1860125 RepID=UPI0014395492|nr:response regulator [Erythrobacter sp. QSSC1-22B]